MNLLFKMPGLGAKELGGQIVEWHIKAGAVINADDLMVSVKTSKGVTTVLQAPQTARVIKTYGNPGDFIQEDAPLVELEDLVEPMPVTDDDLLRRYAELTEQYGDIANIKEISFLLLRWANLEIYQVKPYVAGFQDKAGNRQCKVIEIADAWKIHDYGDYLVTSRGEDYGSGSGATGKLINAAEIMIKRLSERHAREVNIYGHELGKRAAWIKCSDQGISVVNYTPSVEDLAAQARLQKVKAQGIDISSEVRPENR